MIDLSVELFGRRLKNPVIPASGTCGFGRELAGYYDISALGAIATKGITPLPREGNAPPRIAETPSGVINSVGLQNPGVEAFVKDELPWLSAQGVPVIANISGGTIEDYVVIAQKLEDSAVFALEVNISCPNVAHGGAAFGADAKMAAAVTRAVKEAATKPVIVKLTPNVSDIAAIAMACADAGADAISLINTLLAMSVDLRLGKPILGNIMGGLSGAAVKPIALRMAYQVCRAVDIPVIGMGGVCTGQDALEFILCGCTAVQVGTANLADPYACPRIIGEISQYMAENGIESVESLRGALR